MRKIFIPILIFFSFIVCYNVYSQTNFYYKGTGNITLTSSWGTNTDGSGTPPLNFTTANQQFYIVNCSSVSLSNNWTVSGTGSKVILGNGTSSCSFIIPSGNSLTGIIDISANGYLNISNTSIPTLNSLNSASTVEYSGTKQQIKVVTYGNLIISNTGLNLDSTGGAFKVAGNLTIKNMGTLKANHAITTVPGKTFTIENGGRYIHNNLTWVDTTIFAGTESFGAQSTFEINNWLATKPLCPSSLTKSISVPGFLDNFYYGNLVWFVQQGNHYNADIPNGANLCAGSFTISKTAWIPPKTRDFQVHKATESRTFTIFGDFNIGNPYLDASVEVDFGGADTNYTTTLNLYGNFNLINGSALWNATIHNSTIKFLKNGVQNVQQIYIDSTSTTAIQFICFVIGDGTTNTNVQLLNSIGTDGVYPNCIPQVTVNQGATLDLNSFNFAVNNHINSSLPRFIQINGTLNCNIGYIGYGNSTISFTSGPNSFIKINSPDGINLDGTGNIRLNGGTSTFTNGTTFIYQGASVTGNMLPSSIANILIDNAAGVTLSQPLTVSGNANFANGLFDVANNTLTLSGTISRTNGTISVNGTSDIIVSASYIPDGLFPGNELMNLTCNNPAGTSLGGNLTINGLLDVSSGKLNLNSKIITLNPTGLLLENNVNNNVVYGTSGCIQTTLTLTNPNNNPCRGLGVKITDLTHNLGTTIIKRYHSQQTGDGNKSISRWYDISPANNSGLNATAVFDYSPSDLNITPVIPENDLTLYKSTDNGINWILVIPLGILDMVNKEFTSTGIPDFSLWALGNANAPMPVKLTSFTSNVSGRDVILNWTTAFEQNNAGFEILRSTKNDNGNWTKVGYVNGNGTKTTPTNYTFADKKLTKDKYLYKLKQTDYNGNFEYHNLANDVEIGTPKKFEVYQNYPNPFNPVTKIDFDLPYDSKVTIKLYDINGREIMTLINEQKQAGYYTVQMNGDKLPSGMYFYRLLSEGSKEKYMVAKKMMLIK